MKYWNILIAGYLLLITVSCYPKKYSLSPDFLNYPHVELIYSINNDGKVSLQNMNYGVKIGVIELNKQDVYLKSYSYFIPTHYDYLNQYFQIEIQNNCDSDLIIPPNCFIFLKNQSNEQLFSGLIYYNNEFSYPIKWQDTETLDTLYKNDIKYDYCVDYFIGKDCKIPPKECIVPKYVISKNSKKHFIISRAPDSVVKNPLSILEPLKLILKLKKIDNGEEVNFEIKYATESKYHLPPLEETTILKYEEPSATPSPSGSVSASPSSSGSPSPSPSLTPSPSASPSSSVKN